MNIVNGIVKKLLINNIENLKDEQVVVYIDHVNHKDSFNGTITILSYSLNGYMYIVNSQDSIEGFVIRAGTDYLISKFFGNIEKFEDDEELFKKQAVLQVRDFYRKNKIDKNNSAVRELKKEILRIINEEAYSYDSLYSRTFHSTAYFKLHELACEIFDDCFYEIETPQRETDRYKYAKKVIEAVKEAFVIEFTSKEKEKILENKFNVNDQVIHLKTGKKYLIIDTPDSDDLLEHCREPFYKYIAFIIDANGKINRYGEKWSRAKSLFEDGRFKKL